MPSKGLVTSPIIKVRNMRKGQEQPKAEAGDSPVSRCMCPGLTSASTVSPGAFTIQPDHFP